MQATSQLFQQIVSGPYSIVPKILIDGATYGAHELKSVHVDNSLFSGSRPSIGETIVGEIDVTMKLPPRNIPRMAKIQLSVAVSDGVRTSEDIPEGVFYVDSRAETDWVVSLHGFDALIFTEQEFPSVDHSWPASDITVVRDIANLIGVELDPRTVELMDKNFPVNLPTGYSCREALGYIGAMYAGSWTMNARGQLRLVQFVALPPNVSSLADELGNIITIGGVSIEV